MCIRAYIEIMAIVDEFGVRLGKNMGREVSKLERVLDKGVGKEKEESM